MVDRRPNIWKLQANQDIDGLVASLTYSDPDIRKRAAAALRVLGAVAAVEALENALKSERQPDVREHLTAALEHLDTSFSKQVIKEKTRDELIEVLHNSTDPQVLIETTTKLGSMGDQLATEALVMLFRNQLQPDEVRLAAAKALLQLKSAPSVVTLLAGLKKENWRIRHNAAAVLGQLRATWATEPLVEALNDVHPNVRLAAAAALHRFQTKKAAMALSAYQQRRSGKTKPLPRRPEIVQRVNEAPTPATKGKLPNPPMPRQGNNEGGSTGSQNNTKKVVRPQSPSQEMRSNKRETQQIKPRLPITPNQESDEDKDS